MGFSRWRHGLPLPSFAGVVGRLGQKATICPCRGPISLRVACLPRQDESSDVESQLLVCVAWGALMVWNHRASRRFAVGGCGAFVLVKLPGTWCLLLWLATDVLKTLDVGYNLKSATSSSERVQIWAWSVDLSAIGGGSGGWKWAAEGHLQERIGKCLCAATDLLQWLHELGWLPALVMLLLAWRQMWQVVFLPRPAVVVNLSIRTRKLWSPWPCCFGKCESTDGFDHFGWGVELGSTHTRNAKLGSDTTRMNHRLAWRNMKLHIGNGASWWQQPCGPWKKHQIWDCSDFLNA